MEISSITYSIVTSFAVLAGVAFPGKPGNVMSERKQDIFQHKSSAIYAAAKPKCKAGVTKAGKTPISLVPGAKVSCYNIKKAKAGKKLLTTDQTKTCFACHSSIGVSPSSQMNSNLRTQGYTLSPAQLVAAFNAHIAEMPGSTITTKNAGEISAYLQSIP